MASLRRGALVVSVQDDLLEACRDARRSVRLASPYVSRSSAEELAFALRGTRARDKRLLTALDPRAAAIGALSVDGLRSLQAARVEVRTIRNLHAKVFLIDELLAVVGSGNLTGRGLGAGKRSNLELGVVLTVRQQVEAAALFDRWWHAAKVVTERDLRTCEARAAKIRVPRDVGSAIGPELENGRDEGAEWMPRRNRARTGFWMKMHRDDGSWLGRGDEVLSPYSGTADDPKRRPRFMPRDLIVIYAAGTGHCNAIVEVTGPTDFDLGRVRGDTRRGADRWGWWTPVSLIREINTADGPMLRQVGVDTKSVRQQNHIVLTEMQYDRAYAGIVDPGPTT